MRLSTKGRYGLRAMIDIAQKQETGPVAINAIADRQNLSGRYLEQLLTPLKQVYFANRKVLLLLQLMLLL
jgi:DNA-binding IscR family transcriptional regulator